VSVATGDAEVGLRPVVATCQMSWRPTQMLLALYVRDAFDIRARGLEIPRLTPAVQRSTLVATIPDSAARLASQWYLWWRETLDASDPGDTGRQDWSVLYGDGNHPELSAALDLVFGGAAKWLADRATLWEALRRDGYWGSRTPWHPTVVGARRFRGAPRLVVYFAVVPFDGYFARKLRESLYLVSWDFALDKDGFAAWAVPILRDRVDLASDGLG
jgi:hypothetical protein